MLISAYANGEWEEGEAGVKYIRKLEGVVEKYKEGWDVYLGIDVNGC